MEISSLAGLGNRQGISLCSAIGSDIPMGHPSVTIVDCQGLWYCCVAVMVIMPVSGFEQTTVPMPLLSRMQMPINVSLFVMAIRVYGVPRNATVLSPQCMVSCSIDVAAGVPM